MPPRRRIPESSHRSTRPRTDPQASTSVDPKAMDVVSSGVVDAGASTSADPSSSGPADDDCLLHLQQPQLRGTDDVTLLYGLPTTGRVVMGRYDFDDLELLTTYARKHAVRLAKLRKMWNDVDLIADNQDQIDRYTRAFVLELLGCSLFPDATGDSILTFYLDLLRVWSYARLTLCRPTIMKEFTGWGLPSIDTCPPYGRRWTTRPKSKKLKDPSKSEMDYARDVFMKIRPQHVVWRPYDHMRTLMPPYAQHYADRVMHHFMLYQTVLPPRPEAWWRISQLMGYMGTTYRGRDWRQLFEAEVGMWGDMAQVRVMEERPWRAAIEVTYLQ
ncbi:hypothetical protein LUZ61_009528 [Rhynchospora tenuis]|uniref:Uncharacterized protein n=1 Tax=Rhynchospora tenuis TaxID=198213 RepID=A0AAD6EYS0_9POAL|nr:hypothetical protein LUZ61_009528 [Rhynchospora tenuis]